MVANWPNIFQTTQMDNDKQDPDKRHKRRVSKGGYPKCSRQQQQSQLARSPLGLGVVVATSLYCGVKAGIQGYQHLRRRNLRHLVRHVSPVLDDLGVQYWADFGTLLGMYREKDIILHDNDADLVVLNPDWDWLLEALKARLPGFRVFFVVPSEDTSIKWIRVMSGVGIMDLYGGYADVPQADTSNNSSSSSASVAAAAGSGSDLKAAAAMVSIPQGHGDLCDIPAPHVFPLGVMKFKGVPVSVPGDVPAVLRYRYGDTYMIPRYMDKGRDCIEQGKLYARLLGALGKAGLRV